jgi:hypothetical protein
MEMQRLEENVKRELLLIHNLIKDRMEGQESTLERPISKGKSSMSGDIVPLG